MDNVADAIRGETTIESWEFGEDEQYWFESATRVGSWGVLVFRVNIVATQPFRRIGGLYEQIR
jgi:hypothetical protein